MKMIILFSLAYVLVLGCGPSVSVMQHSAADQLLSEAGSSLASINLVLKGFEFEPAKAPLDKEERTKENILFCSRLVGTFVDLEDEKVSARIPLMDVLGKDDGGKVVLYGRASREKLTAQNLSNWVLMLSKFQWSYRTYLREIFSLETLSKGITSYLNEHYLPENFPEDFDYLKEKDKLIPMHLGQNDYREKDAWGHAILVQIKDGSVWVGSSGTDGQFQGWEQSGRYSFQEARGKDLIFRNGEAIFCPQLKN